MDIVHPLPKIETSLCPDSQAIQKNLTPFIRRTGNAIEDQGLLTSEEALRRASTSSDTNYVSGWMDRASEKFKPVTGKDDLPSFASPQTSRKSFHLNTTGGINVSKSKSQHSSSFELKTGAKNSGEQVLALADRSLTRPRSTLFSEIRKNVFGSGRQANPQVMEELNRYREKFQKEKMEKSYKENLSFDSSISMGESLQSYPTQPPKHGGDDNPVGLSPPIHHQEKTNPEFHSIATTKEQPVLLSINKNMDPIKQPLTFSTSDPLPVKSSTWVESPKKLAPPPSQGVFDFVPVSDKKIEMKEDKTQEKTWMQPQTISTVESQKSIEDAKLKSKEEFKPTLPKIQLINQKIVCTNPKGLSKLSRIDWAKKRFVDENTNKFHLSSLTQSRLASLGTDNSTVTNDDKQLNSEVENISAEYETLKTMQQDAKNILPPETETKEENGNSKFQFIQNKLEPPSISAKVLRISPTPLKLHKLETVSLSVSNSKNKISTQNSDLQLHQISDETELKDILPSPSEAHNEIQKTASDGEIKSKSNWTECPVDVDKETEATPQYIQTSVKPMDFGISFSGKKDVRLEPPFGTAKNISENNNEIDAKHVCLESSWNQSAPMQTVTKLTSSNVLKITSVTRGQPPQLLPAVVQAGRPYWESPCPVGISQEPVTKSLPVDNSSLISPEIKSHPVITQKQNTSTPVKSSTEVTSTHARDDQLAPHQLQKVKLFTGSDSQAFAQPSLINISNKTIDKDNIKSTHIKLNSDDIIFQSSQQRNASDVSKSKSTYAHGPKISFSSLKAAGKIPSRLTYREENYTYPGGYVRGEYYSLGLEINASKYQPQEYKNPDDEKFATTVASSLEYISQPQSSKFTLGALTSHALRESITQSVSSFVQQLPKSSSSTTLLPTTTPTSAARDFNGSDQKTINLESSISRSESHPTLENKIFSQDQITTTDDRTNNRMIFFPAAKQEIFNHENPQQSEKQIPQQIQQRIQQQFEIKPASAQKISVSSNQMKDSHKSATLTLTAKKLTPLPVAIQTSQKVKVEPQSFLPFESVNKELKINDQNYLNQEIEAQFSKLKIEEDDVVPAVDVLLINTICTPDTPDSVPRITERYEHQTISQTSLFDPKFIEQNPLTTSEEIISEESNFQVQDAEDFKSLEDSVIDSQKQIHQIFQTRQQEQYGQMQHENKQDEPLQPITEDLQQVSPEDPPTPQDPPKDQQSPEDLKDPQDRHFVETMKLLAEKRLSEDDLIREPGKQPIGFKVNHMMAALGKQSSYAAALSSQKKVLNQRGTAVESGHKVKEQLEQLKSPQPQTSDTKKSPRLLRKPQPLISKSKTVDDPHYHHLSFGPDPDLKLLLKSRKKKFSTSSDEEKSKLNESLGPKRNIGESVVPISDRIKHMETLVGGSFFSALRDKALSSNQGSSLKSKDQNPRSLQASFDVISDVTVGERKKDFGKLKQHAMETRRNIQQLQERQQLPTDDTSSYLSSASSGQLSTQHVVEDMSYYKQQLQQSCDDDPFQQQSTRQSGEEYHHRQLERQRQPYPERQPTSTFEPSDINSAVPTIRDLPPQSVPLRKGGAGGRTRPQTMVHGGSGTSQTTSTTTTPTQRRSLCSKLDSDDEFDKLVEFNYQQLVDPFVQAQHQQQSYSQQQFQYQHSERQQEQCDRQKDLQQPVHSQRQPTGVQQRHLDPRHQSQKHHERHHSPSAYPREPIHQPHQQQQRRRHREYHRQQQQEYQQQPRQQSPTQLELQLQQAQQQKPQFEPAEELPVGSVTDLVSQWDAAIEQKLLKQQQLQALHCSTPSGFNVNASGISGRSPTFVSQKQTTHGDGMCPAGTTTSGQRVVPSPSSGGRRVSIEDAAAGDELTKLSISEKMKIFSIEVEKQRKKAIQNKNRRTDSRYQTQPVTWGEVEIAHGHVRESSNQRSSGRMTTYERHEEDYEDIEPIASRDYIFYGDC